MLKAVKNANTYTPNDIPNSHKIFGYTCEKCKQDYVEVCLMSARTKNPKCECGQLLESLILGIPDFSVHGNITTLGQLAEHNTKKMGKYKVSELDEKNKKEVDEGMRMYEKPTKELTHKLSKATPQQKEKYINEGKI